MFFCTQLTSKFHWFGHCNLVHYYVFFILNCYLNLSWFSPDFSLLFIPFLSSSDFHLKVSWLFTDWSPQIPWLLDSDFMIVYLRFSDRLSYISHITFMISIFITFMISIFITFMISFFIYCQAQSKLKSTELYWV